MKRQVVQDSRVRPNQLAGFCLRIQLLFCSFFGRVGGTDSTIHTKGRLVLQYVHVEGAALLPSVLQYQCLTIADAHEVKSLFILLGLLLV